MAEPESNPEGGTPVGDTSKKGGASWWLDIFKVAAMPLVTLIVGFLINSSLDSRQARESNVRLYADMMGRREESDSALRKDMFKSILDTFMQKDPKMQPDQYLDQQILDLELLAYNFHESLDLGPLFKHVRRQIPNDDTGPNVDKRARLEKVAQEVNDRQLTVLSDSGAVVKGSVELEDQKVTSGRLMFSGPSVVTGKDSKPPNGLLRLCLQLNPEGGEPNFRQFSLEAVEYDPKTREVYTRLYASHPLPESECRRTDLDQAGNKEVDINFWVGLFDYPMIDNTRLSHGERCSVSITQLTPDFVELSLAYFPGSRASLKDKPYYDELMHDLLRSEKQSAHKEH
jgi:hypothetical protein